jgi:dihydroneopterin aldolase
MMFYSYHGASRAERETGRRYEVDVEIHADLARAADSDHLADTINYTRVYDTVAEIILKHKFHLLETIAARITRDIKEGYEVDRVVVRVRKKIPPIPGNLDYIEVEFDSQTDVA